MTMHQMSAANGSGSDLPQLTGPFLTDGGLETTLIFHDGFDLPLFAAFPLIADPAGRAAMRRYYERYLAIAEAAGTGFVLESPTWRASRGWGARLGYTREAIAEVNRRAIDFMVELRDGFRGAGEVVISGAIGPAGDGYNPQSLMTPDAAEEYHTHQVAILAGTEADLVSAFTMTHSGEAIGIASAARKARIPAAISFTLETDGRLPSGESLRDAIAAVDAASDGYPAYYMINCAHPTHFASVLEEGGSWLERLSGVRANASKRSHAELDSAPDLDDGDPAALGGDYARLMRALPRMTVFGGCCGTDHRHVQAMARACFEIPEAPARRAEEAMMN